MIEISELELHFLQALILVAGIVGYIWGREVGVKKGIFETEKRLNKRD